MSRKSHWIATPLLVLSLLIFFHGSPQAASQPCKSVDGFVILFDLSQSRSDSFEPQLELGKKFIDKLPNLDYQAAIRVFWQAHFPKYGAPTSQLIYGPTRMEKSAMQSAFASQQPKEAITPLGPAMNAAAGDLAKMPGRNALIIFSDFEESERFGNPLAEAKALAAKFPDLCIVAIHFGTRSFSETLAKEVANASKCGKYYDGTKFFNDDAALAAMIQEIFTKNCPEPVTISLYIEFDFDKADIRPQHHNDIKKAADYLIANPNTIAVIEGHTDSRGTDQYNEKLSQRRAESVMKYMVEKFNIDAGRLRAKGFGEAKPVADNDTDAGRQKNRRVDVVISSK